MSSPTRKKGSLGPDTTLLRDEGEVVKEDIFAQMDYYAEDGETVVIKKGTRVMRKGQVLREPWPKGHGFIIKSRVSVADSWRAERLKDDYLKERLPEGLELDEDQIRQVDTMANLAVILYGAEGEWLQEKLGGERGDDLLDWLDTLIEADAQATGWINVHVRQRMTDPLAPPSVNGSGVSSTPTTTPKAEKPSSAPVLSATASG